jgi:exportin-T
MHGQADAQDTVDVLALMVQLMSRFKDAMLQLVEGMLPPVAARVGALLGPDWDWSGRQAQPPGGAAAVAAVAGAAAPAGDGNGGGAAVAATLEEAREKGELQRAYYSFLLGLAQNGLTGALLQAPPAVLDSVLTSLTKGAATHVDPTVRRTCLQVGGAGVVGRVGAWVWVGWQELRFTKFT